MTWEEAIAQLWMQSLEALWSLHHGERTNELRGGKYTRRRDERGLDFVGMEAGRIYACQTLIPELRFAEFDPVDLRRLARASAWEDFVRQVKAGEIESPRPSTY